MDASSRDFLERAIGASIDKLLPAVSFFSWFGTGGSSDSENRIEKKNRVIDLLETYFDKFSNV